MRLEENITARLNGTFACRIPAAAIVKTKYSCDLPVLHNSGQLKQCSVTGHVSVSICIRCVCLRKIGGALTISGDVFEVSLDESTHLEESLPNFSNLWYSLPATAV